MGKRRSRYVGKRCVIKQYSEEFSMTCFVRECFRTLGTDMLSIELENGPRMDIPWDSIQSIAAEKKTRAKVLKLVR